MNSTGLNFSSVQYPGFEKRLQYIDDNRNQTIRIINKNSINRNALVEAEIPFSSFVSASILCTISVYDKRRRLKNQTAGRRDTYAI